MRIFICTLACSLFMFVLTFNVNDDSVLDIAAFNVRIFGINKMKDHEVKRNLVRILLRYDLVLIQEIRDGSGGSIQTLLSALNMELSKSIKGASYKMVLSPRLGRSNSKEEYAYIYRADLLSVSDTFTFNDKYDLFEREPYVARFHSSLAAVQDFAVAGIHTSPRDASNEISHLTKVYDEIQRKWRLDDVIIMGDYNAGCNYVKEWDKVELAKDKRFFWIIDNGHDTTAEISDCPYDRMVVAGQKMIQNVLPFSGGVFNYDEEYGLTSKQSLAVSDHYPVHMQIKHKEESDFNWFSESITTHDRRVNSALINKPSKIYNLRADAKLSAKFTVSEKYKKTGGYSEVTIETKSTTNDEIHRDLDQLQLAYPQFVSINQIKMVKRFIRRSISKAALPRGHRRYQTLFDFYKNRPSLYSLKLICSLEVRQQPKCSLTASVQQQ